MEIETEKKISDREIIKHTLMKMSSGRWILTVIGGGVFAYVAITGELDKAATAAILTAIFTSYFQRNRNGKETV